MSDGCQVFLIQGSAKIAWNWEVNPADLLMPTVLRSGPYRVFFYAGDRHERPHVVIYRLISEQQTLLLEKWHEYFGDS